MRCLYRGSGGLLGLVLVAVLLTGVGCKPEVEPPAPVDAGVDGGPGQSCDGPPPSCEALERNCGEVTDACGRTLQCGTCSALQTCGGGGTPGQCGGRACETDCPAGYTCAADGTCTGSPRTALALDLKVFEVEGQFVHDGVPFSEAKGCLLPSGAGVYLDLKFTEVRSGAVYDANPECHASRGWLFKTWLPAGAYHVDVSSLAGEPSHDGIARLRLSSFFSVQESRTGVRFDLSTQRTPVSGRVALNGPPLPAGSDLRLRFVERSTGSTLLMPLDAVGRFQGRLPRGLHGVTLTGGQSPTGADALLGELQVDGPREGVELTLAPTALEVAGRITRDGQQLQDGTCYGQGSRQTFVRFVDSSGQGTAFQVECWQQETGWTFQGRLAPGNYRVELEPRDYGARGTPGGVPQGKSVLLPRLELREPRRDLSLDVKTHAVSGSIVQTGAALPAGLCDFPGDTPPAPGADDFTRHTYVELHDVVTGVATRLAVDCYPGAGWTFQGRVLPGLYAATLLPRATLGTAEDPYPDMAGFVAPFRVEVSGDREGLVLDLVRHEVAGRILFHPGHFTVTCQPEGATQLRLVEPRIRREQRLDIRCDGENAWTFRGAVFPGAYVSNLFVSDHYPNGKVFVNLPALEVSGPRPELVLSTAPDATTVSGTLTRSGQQIGIPSTCGYVLRWTNYPLYWLYTLPHVVLVDTHDGSRWKLPIQCGDAATGDTQWTFSGRAPEGTYRVELELDHTRRRETPVQDSELGVFVPGPVDVIIPRLELFAGD